MDTGVIGAVTVMKSFVSDFGTLSATIHGLVVSSILIPAAISSCFAGRLADVLGRPKAIAIGALIFGLGAALEAGGITLSMFISGRILEGIGEGLYLGTLVVYICEISPPSQRGPLTAGPQLFTTFGLMVGFFICYGSTALESSLAWPWLVPSPRWLVLRGRQAEASAAWDTLGVASADREKIEVDLQAAAGPHGATSAGTTRPIDASAAGSAVPVAKQGFLDIFAPDVRSPGLTSSESSFLASGMSGIVIFAMTIPALIFADKWGRRPSTIYGGIGIAIVMFLIGGLYAGDAVHRNSGAGRWVVIVSIYVYAAIFCVSWAVGYKVEDTLTDYMKSTCRTSLKHSDGATTPKLADEFTGLILRPSRQTDFPQQFTIESLGLLAVSALKEEALLDYNEPLFDYKSADSVYPENAIDISLHAEVAAFRPAKAKRSTVMWAINEAAVQMMQTYYLRRMPFIVYFHHEHLYSGLVALENDPAAPKTYTANTSRSVGNTSAPLSLVAGQSKSSIVSLASISPLQDEPDYTLAFDFVDSPGSVISQYHIFRTLMAFILRLAPIDSYGIIPRVSMTSLAWIFMEEAFNPVQDYRFQQYHAVAIAEAISKYYELHGQYRELTFRFYANGRSVARGCVTRPSRDRYWCEGMFAEHGLQSTAGSGDTVATS
ncbi:MAG: hypothetical protein Q9208_007474 [Pyrenodesmia sp. 3 TL-2023]